MSDKSDERFVDLVTWYKEHESTEKSLANEVAFLKTANRNLLALLGFVLDDVRSLEGRRELRIINERIFTPTGAEIRGVQHRAS